MENTTPLPGIEPETLTSFKKVKKTEEELKERTKFINWLKSKNLKDRSILNYLFYYDKIFPAKNLTQNNVDAFLKRYKYNTIIISTINNYLTFVKINKKYFKGYIRSAVNNIFIPNKTGSKERKLPQVITEIQMKRIESYLDSERNKLMLLLSFYSGIRLAGLINIHPQSFDWNGWNESGKKSVGKLKVLEKGEKERIVLLPCGLLARIEVWIKKQISIDEKSFVKKEPKINTNKSLFSIGSRRWQKILENTSKKALGFSIHPSTLRHSFATHLFKRGIKIEKIQKLLDHKDISTTMIYTHLDQKDIEEDFEKVINY